MTMHVKHIWQNTSSKMALFAQNAEELKGV